MRNLLSSTLTPSRPARRSRPWFRLRFGRRGGPSPAECLIPQMQERERRKLYQDHDVSTQAPNKLIGYVSAGSFERPGTEPTPKRKPHGRAWVVAFAVSLLAIWLEFAGA